MSVATVFSGIASGMVDDDGRTSKLFRIKNAIAQTLCTADLVVARPNKVVAERLL